MWPINFKAAKKKMRQYSAKRKHDESSDDDNDTNPILTQLPGKYHQCERALEEFIERVP